MSSPSDDESRSDSEQEYSDRENNGSPETWEAPNEMSQTMMKRMQQFNQSKVPVKYDSPSISKEFVTSLSRVSKSETTPPPERERPETTPPPEGERPETTPPPEGERPETTPPPEGERPDLYMLTDKEKAKMFNKTLQEQKTNPFSALKLPLKDYEEAVKTDKDSNPVDPSSDTSSSERTQTDKDTNPVEPSSDKSTSERTQTDKDSNPVEPSSDKSTSERTQTDKDSNPVEPSSDKSISERTRTDKDSNPVDPSSDKSTSGQGNKEKQPLQGHHFSEEPIEEHIPEQLNECHSGPRSAHRWPGTPPVRQLLYQSRPYSPYQQRQPLEQKGYIGRPDLPPTGPYNLQNLSPHHMWPGYGYPPRPQHFPPFNPQNRYETPRGIPPKHYRHETPGDIPPQQFRQDPQDTTSREPPVHGEQSPTNPKQVPTKKKTLLGQPGQTPKKSERKGLSEGKKPANKPGIQPTDNKKGPKTAIKPVPPIKKMGPKKIYLCVVGIAKDQSNDTVFNYLEGRSKMEIVYEESLRTEDNLEHAVIVFEDQIDLKVLKQACNSKKLKDSELEFDVIDPPKSIIVSSDDDKLTVKGVTDFLTKKKLETLKVRTTEEGSISVKFKSPKGVTEILKSTCLKIGGSNVVISVIYNCDHGTYWDHSLHRVAIPVPYKPKVLDKHVRSFVISITSTCNEHLEQHHACLSIKDEIHIDCTLDPKHREARQKVKSWKSTVIKAWDEFVQSNAHKKDLKITHDIKDLLVEHINSTKERHRSDELTVTHDDDSMTIIFVGRSDIVENFYDEVSAKKEEIQENLKRKNRIQTESMNIKPIEISLILKENKFNELKNIAPDFNYHIDEENGMITFTGVKEDISEAKLAVFEVKKNYYTWKMTTLSCNQCRLLKNEAVGDILEQSLIDNDITAVFDIRENEVHLCTTCQDECKPVEDIFKDIVVEDKIRLDDTSKNVLWLDEWAEQKVNITNQFRDVSYVDDSADDRIVVVATYNVLNEIMKDLNKFVTEHSIYDETIKIKDEAELKYFKMHLKDWVKDLEFQNNVQGLRIKFDNQSLQLSGTKQAITTASSDIHSQIRKIQRDQHTITKAGVDSLFNDQSKTDVLLSPIEEESKTVIIVDQNSLTKAPLHGNPVRKESHEDWLRRQPSKNFSRKGTRPKQGAFTPKSGPVVCKNGTKITLVKKEDIGQQKADVIVCSTNWQLDMTAPVGKSIVKVAGKGILDEIKNTYSEGINHGDIAVVNGYNLQCQKVYLAALPKWTPDGEKIISKCVNTCLLQASKFKSIVFPGMGTGNLHYPRDQVAEVMYQCVQKFDHTNSSLKEIKFLCFDRDTIQAFEREEAKIMNPGYQPAVAAPRKQTNYKKHNITVRVVEGDLGKQKVDVMVSAVPKDLNLESAGGAGISIMKGLGQVVQQDITNQHPNGVTNGALAVVTLSSPVGRCKAVYLTSLDSWNSEKKVKDTDKQIYKFGYNCLETADRAGYKSIAIPAMGTGTIGYPRDKVAAYMYDLVEKFANNHKQSKVSEVIFVVHHKDPKSKQAFLDEEKNRVPPPAPVVVPTTGALHGFATEEISTHTAVTVEPINDTDFQVGKLTFTVEQGDILSKRCDAIVNGSNDDLDLTKGAVSQAIRKKCDAAKLDAECTKKKDDMKQYGLVSTSGCGLPVKYIIHISSKHKPHEWRKVIKKALHKAERKAVKTLAFPALGTGAAGTDQEEMGKTIMESLVEFVGEGQTTHLQHVYLVIFEAKMVQPMLKGVRSGGQAVLSADKQKQVIKSSNQQMSSVSFWIYSMSQRETSDAKQQLDKAVLEKYKTEKSHDRLISELRPNELSLLQSVENNYPIMLTIDQRSSEVTIEGIAEYAMSAKQDVIDWLRKFAHKRHCEAEAEIIKEQVQWFMKNNDPMTGTMTLEPYPPMVNMHLENAYKGTSNRTDVDFIDEHGEEYIIDLKTMTEFPKKNPKDRMDVIRREKIQGHGGTFEPPPDWIDQGTDHVKVVTLSNTTPEYQSIENKFTTSVKNGQFAKTSPDVKNKKVTVTKIERIQNLNLFRMYAAKRSLMEKQNQNVKNEQELWHGTPESAIVSINLYGFNRSYCASNSQDAWWGQGVYFANDASYSVRDFLARPGAGGPSQERNIYLCLVLTGVSRKGTKHEPLRVLPQRPDGTMLPYDSNTDDLNPPIEYVVFNDTQAYPLYRIKFTLT